MPVGFAGLAAGVTTVGLIGSGRIGSTVEDEKGTPAGGDVIRAALAAVR
jgi:hypothetical protein